MKTEIFPMGEEHLDSLAELEKICFSQPWSRQALADELEMIVRFFSLLKRTERFRAMSG